MKVFGVLTVLSFLGVLWCVEAQGDGNFTDIDDDVWTNGTDSQNLTSKRILVDIKPPVVETPCDSECGCCCEDCVTPKPSHKKHVPVSHKPCHTGCTCSGNGNCNCHGSETSHKPCHSDCCCKECTSSTTTKKPTTTSTTPKPTTTTKKPTTTSTTPKPTTTTKKPTTTSTTPKPTTTTKKPTTTSTTPKPTTTTKKPTRTSTTLKPCDCELCMPMTTTTHKPTTATSTTPRPCHHHNCCCEQCPPVTTTTRKPTWKPKSRNPTWKPIHKKHHAIFSYRHVPVECVGENQEICCPAEDGAQPVYIAHHQNSQLFFACSWGVAMLMECPATTVFDSTLNVCVTMY